MAIHQLYILHRTVPAGQTVDHVDEFGPLLQLVAGGAAVEEFDPIVLDAPIYTRKLTRRKDGSVYVECTSSNVL